ncbi:MAG: hypothetical protein ACK55Z_25665, partial [bacterium]
MPETRHFKGHVFPTKSDIELDSKCQNVTRAQDLGRLRHPSIQKCGLGIQGLGAARDLLPQIMALVSRQRADGTCCCSRLAHLQV